MTEQQTGAPAPRGRWRVRSGSHTVAVRRQGMDTDSQVDVAEFLIGEVTGDRATIRVVRAGADWSVASWQVTVTTAVLAELLDRSVREPDLIDKHDVLGGYFQAGTALFQGPPHPADIAQGLVGDCRVASAFQAVAATPGGPALIQSLITTGTDVYRVRLVPTAGPKSMPASGATATAIEISDYLPVTRNDKNPLYLLSGTPYGPTSSTPIWPAVLEKAFATMWGGYAALDGAEERPVFAALGLGDITHVNWMSGDESKPAVAKTRIMSLAKDGYAITTAAARGPRHNYAVIGVTEDGPVIADPNTKRGAEAEKRWKSAEVVAKLDKMPTADQFPLHFTWDAFFQNFMWIYAALPPKKK
ncbi:C2 family cysteine protease [Actinomadura gamaensis]|uniref:C2 family cysteine protease n=1 Tax=Actinomadura gamaensis TaxID=1763541 RepID=A0ABV9TRL1_9ACTN